MLFCCNVKVFKCVYEKNADKSNGDRMVCCLVVRKTDLYLEKVETAEGAFHQQLQFKRLYFPFLRRDRKDNTNFGLFYFISVLLYQLCELKTTFKCLLNYKSQQTQYEWTSILLFIQRQFIKLTSVSKDDVRRLSTSIRSVEKCLLMTWSLSSPRLKQWNEWPQISSSSNGTEYKKQKTKNHFNTFTFPCT